jgi:hypothetical protein
VADLDRLDPAQAGKAGIQAALDKVQTNLATLKTSARSQWGSQITELDNAVGPSRPPSPGSTATACSRPYRRSSFHPLRVMPAVPVHLRVKEAGAEEALS